MTKDPIKKKLQFPIVAFIIRKKGTSTPWANEFYLSEDLAKERFDEFCADNGLELDWEDYQCIQVEIIKFKK